MAPAMIVARELDIRKVDTISVKSYDWQEQAEAVVLKAPDAELMGDGTGILIVDDLADTGKTLELVRRRYPKAHFATVYRQAAGAGDGGHLRHRGEPGHLDLLPLGHGPTIRGTVSGAVRGAKARCKRVTRCNRR
jgi:adenine/guanine phosphoribosyltransferase-like PRPP-binding protein